MTDQAVSTPRIYFGPSYGRNMEPDHVASVMDLLRTRDGVPPVVYRPECNDALIERSRAKAATKFLKTDCDVLLSIDSDIAFDGEAALEICRQAVTKNVVAGVYVTRSRARCFPTSLLFTGQTMDFGGDSRTEEIRWAATGFLAVHRRVYEALAKRQDMPLCHEGSEMEMRPFYTPFPYQLDGKWILLSEDFAFCERARQAGFRVYANPAVRLYHLGQYPYRLEDLLAPEPPRGAFVSVTRLEGGQYRVEMPADAPNPSDVRAGPVVVQTLAGASDQPTPALGRR